MSINDKLKKIAEGGGFEYALTSFDAEQLLISLSLQNHYHELQERTTDALNKIRQKRHTGEPARSDVQEIEDLVSEVLSYRRNDAFRKD